MKFRKKNADMSPFFNFMLEEEILQPEIILLAEKLCYAAVFILKRADKAAFGTHPLHIEPTFLQGLLEAFCLTSLGYHPLCLAMELGVLVSYRNNCIFLFPLSAPFDLFILKASRASGPSKACTED
jgi:hypothetical protein